MLNGAGNRVHISPLVRHGGIWKSGEVRGDGSQWVLESARNYSTSY